MAILTEFDLDYDRLECIELQREGQKCQVLTQHPPLWPLLDADFSPIEAIDSPR
ncbi:MAG: hypothetical protein QGG67_12400 [Gammaproteobacteria bacterium]|jgi:hypothetical protein|nr:hypothetical protein [Gammaproteobacteria bacterium]|tara:strand:+ start:264 stop:425 length:162 start_codon:yes stop_codon:yes gene_type:complete